MNQNFTIQRRGRWLARIACIALMLSALMLSTVSYSQDIIKFSALGSNGGGGERKGASLATALQGVQLDTIVELSVDSGRFTANDWRYLRDNRANWSVLRHFSIQYGVKCDSIPDSEPGQPYLPNIENLYIGFSPKINYVGNYAFDGLDKIDHFDFRDTVSVIGVGAFRNCAVMRFFRGPYVKSIGDYAFAGCTGLERIDLSYITPMVGVGAFPTTLPANATLNLVGDNGYDITGDSLAIGLTNYYNDEGYNAATKTWHGFQFGFYNFRGVVLQLNDDPKSYVGNSIQSALTPYIMAQPNPYMATTNIRKITVTGGYINEAEWQTLDMFNQPFALHIVGQARAEYYYYDNNTYALVSNTMPHSMSELVDTVTWESYGLAPYQFEWSELTRVHFEYLQEVNDGMFLKSLELQSVYLPFAKYVYDNAFVDCEKLTDVGLPQVAYVYGRSFAGCSALSHIDLSKVRRLNYLAFAYCPKLKSLTLPKVELFYVDDVASTFPVSISTLGLPAAPPVFKTDQMVDAVPDFDKHYPAERYIQLVDDNGQLLTGQALTDAVEAYKKDAGWDVATQKWWGWTIADGSTANTTLYQISTVGNGAQIDLSSNTAKAGDKVQVTITGPLLHYLSNTCNIDIYKTGDVNSGISFSLISQTGNERVIEFDMPAYDVTVEVNYDPNVMQITVNGSTQRSGLSLEQCLQGISSSMVKSLSVASANIFATQDWAYISTNLTELEHFSMDDNIQSLANPVYDFRSLTKLKSFSAPIDTLIGSFFEELYNLEDVNLPKVRYVEPYAFLDTYSLQNITLPSVEELANFALDNIGAYSVCLPKVKLLGGYSVVGNNLQLLQLPATPPTCSANAFDYLFLPSLRYLQLVGDDCQPLTGDALTAGIAAYKADDGWDASTELWYGFKLIESGMQLYRITPKYDTQAGWLNLSTAIETVGATINVAGDSQNGYIFRGIKVYRTGEPTQQVVVDEVAAGGFTFDMPAYDVTVEAVFELNSIEITINGSIAGSGSTLINAIGSTPFGYITSLRIDRAKIFGQYTSSMLHDWHTLLTMPNLEHLHITAGVDSIWFDSGHSSIFSKLKTFTIDNCVEYGGHIENSPMLHTVNLPKTKYLRSDAFVNNPALTAVNLPMVEEVGNHAFYGSGLTSVSLPKAVYVEAYAFKDDSLLTSASLPQVEFIGTESFKGCPALNQLYLGATPPTVDADAFDPLPATRYLQLVDVNGNPLEGGQLSAAVNDYQKHDGWDGSTHTWYGWTIMQGTTVTYESICYGQSYTWTDGNTYTTAGSYLDNSDIANPKTLILDVIRPENGYVATQICQGETYNFNGKDYSRTGVYNVTLQSAAGCDSIVSLNLKVNKPVQSEVYEVAQGSYIWFGQTLTEPGDYVHTTTASTGCDSTITLHLAITGVYTVRLASNIASAGTFTGAGSYAENTVATVQAFASEGYIFKQWSNGVTDNPYSFVVTGDTNLTAQFEVITYTLTYAAGANGSVTGNLSQTVNHGQNGTPVEAKANSGYKFWRWSDNRADNPRTDANVKANVNVTAEFIEENVTLHTLTYTASVGGSIRGAAIQQVVDGEGGAEVTAVADKGYRFVRWSDGNTNASRTDANVHDNLSVIAEFELIPTYMLSYIAGEGGSIDGTTTQTVSEGESGSEVEAVPNEGYRFVKWSDGLTTAKRTDSNVQANLSVTAEFEKLNTTDINTAKFDALSVHPNPTKGVVQVEATGVVLVGNVAGQILQQIPAHGMVLIDLSAYPAGMYIIRVGNAVAKVVKQ